MYIVCQGTQQFLTFSFFFFNAFQETHKLGSFVYGPCEVMKQRMQVQGRRTSWNSVNMKANVSMKSGIQMYDYYT